MLNEPDSYLSQFQVFVKAFPQWSKSGSERTVSRVTSYDQSQTSAPSPVLVLLRKSERSLTVTERADEFEVCRSDRAAKRR